MDNPSVTPHHPEAFRQELRDLGYVEGRNLAIEYDLPRVRLSSSPLLRPNWFRSGLMSSWLPPWSPPWLPSKRPAPSPFSRFLSPFRAGSSPAWRARAAMSQGWPSSPGATRQLPGTAQAGRSGGQTGRCPLAAKWPERTHGNGKGHAEGTRSHDTGAEGATRRARHRGAGRLPFGEALAVPLGGTMTSLPLTRQGSQG